MMSLKSKRELLEVVRPRYLKASKLEKQKMLDEFTSATGYHRKYAIRVLKNQRQVQNHLKGKTKTYKPIYGGEVVQVLEQIWEIYGQICSKRLQPMLPEAMKVLERCKEINIPKATKELLSLAPPARAGVENWFKLMVRRMIGLKGASRRVACWSLLTMPQAGWWNCYLSIAKVFSVTLKQPKITSSATVSQ